MKHALEKELVVGIDIGGTYTKIGLVTKQGKVLKNSFFKTGAKASFAVFEKKLKEEINILKADIKEKYKIIGVGVGAPNANFHTGQMEHPPNFKWGDYIPISKSIEKIFNLPIIITNDANAAALGELKFGMAKKMKNFVVLTLGTGLGSGIIVDGKLLVGAHGMAGEIGHVNVNPKGRKCNCGLQGCLETYVSVTGIKRTVFELIAEMREDSPLLKISYDDMTGEMIAEAALEGDVIALRAFEYTATILGSKMADTAAHLDPEAFILTGGLSKAGNILLKPLIESMEKNLFVAYKGKIKVMISKTPNYSAVLGPAALALQQVEV